MPVRTKAWAVRDILSNMALDDTPKELAAGPFAAFRYTSYRLFWIGNAFSNIGIWALMAGRLWLMYQLTDSPLMLGLVTFSGLGPILLLSMWGGVVADRVNRMRLVVTTRALFSFTALLTGILAATDIIEPWHLLAISLANGVLLSFDIPCRQAIVPNLVPRQHLMNAVVLQSLLMSGSTVIGPFLFVPLVKALDIEGVFFFVGAMYVGTVVMFALVDPQPHIGDRKRTMPWRDLMEGFDYIRGSTTIVSLVALGILAGIFGSSFGTLLPVFADTVLGGGVETYGNLLLASGIGGIERNASLDSIRQAEGLGIAASGVGADVWTRPLALRADYLPARISVVHTRRGRGKHRVRHDQQHTPSKHRRRRVPRKGDEHPSAGLGVVCNRRSADGLPRAGGQRSICTERVGSGHSLGSNVADNVGDERKRSAAE